MFSSKSFTPHSALKYCLGLALVLTATMAILSNYDRHPDESNHLSASQYYQSHFLPPQIGDPTVRDSYSVWGVSYLNYQWVEYFFAGRFISLTSPFIHDAKLGARFFNLFLFVLLAAVFFYRSTKDNSEFIVPCFLLVTPQVWYVFSYSNNDAFALFVSILLAYEIVSPRSFLREYLRSPSFSSRLIGGVFAGLLFGLLIICKPNYWVFLLFAAIWILLNFPFNTLILKKYTVIATVALCVFALRIGLDFYVNGETNFAGATYINYFLRGLETKPGKLVAYQEEIADYEFKPSTLETDPAHSHPEVGLKAKGTSAVEMLSKWRWHLMSFGSFVGVYGYMNLWGPRWYYAAMSLLFIIFGFYLIGRIFAVRDHKRLTNLAITAVGCLLAMVISFYLSWNYAFQPQGRYLFPVLPMLAVLVYSNRNLLNNVVMNGLLIISFVLSVFSFVFVGLAHINSSY